MMSSATNSELLQCYNISCGKKYYETDNHDEACVYHEGKPYFHDGYKEWTCCKMRSRDFTTFMGYKGCMYLFILFVQFFGDSLFLFVWIGAKGRHNNVRVEEPKQESAPETEQSNGDFKVEVEEEMIPFVPPDSTLVENIKIVESANVSSSQPTSNSIICKNCKLEESMLDSKSECHYHRGVQV